MHDLGCAWHRWRSDDKIAKIPMRPLFARMLHRVTRPESPGERFVVEALLVSTLIYVAGSVNALFKFFPNITEQVFKYMIVIADLFMAIVFYGTSGEVTPLRLLTLLYPFFPKMKNRSREIRFSTGQTGEGLVASPHPQRTVTAETILESATRSAAKLATKMERRINTHLILGIFVGLIGLLVWYFSFSFATLDKDHLVTQLLPRVTILFFIELLAGFFLRQYRIGVEDLKYFLELERHAVCRRVAYSILFGTDFSDAAAKRKFVTALIEERSNLFLRKGESTTVLEAMKTEENIALKAFGVLGEQLERVTKLAHDRK